MGRRCTVSVTTLRYCCCPCRAGVLAREAHPLWSAKGPVCPGRAGVPRPEVGRNAYPLAAPLGPTKGPITCSHGARMPKQVATRTTK
jgi:hypothetical protein